MAWEADLFSFYFKASSAFNRKIRANLPDAESAKKVKNAIAEVSLLENCFYLSKQISMKCWLLSKNGLTQLYCIVVFDYKGLH